MENRIPNTWNEKKITRLEHLSQNYKSAMISYPLIRCRLTHTHHTVVVIKINLLFAKGAKIHPPSKPLVTILPAKVTKIVDIQQDSGCWLRNV